MKFLSQDRVQTRLRRPARHVPVAQGGPGQVGASDADCAHFFKAIQQGRTYAPIPQWGQIENAYKTRFGNILDEAAQQGASFSDAEITKQLDAAAKEANALLAQGTG